MEKYEHFWEGFVHHWGKSNVPGATDTEYDSRSKVWKSLGSWRIACPVIIIGICIRIL